MLGVGTPVAIASDINGDAWIAGLTTSTDFPVSAGAVQSKLNRAGNSDLFITHVNSLGKQLLYSTYLGGLANEQASDLALDATGNVYVGGATYSTAFPGSSETLGEVGTGFVLQIIRIVCRLVPSAPSQWIDHGGQPRVGRPGNLRHRDNHLYPLPDDSGAYRRSCSRHHRWVVPFYVRIAASDGVVKAVSI